jgi:uncharacterized protein YaiE (UPF0345 family)
MILFARIPVFKHNQYFDGKVASLAFKGEKLATTVGVMAPGEYTFDTSQKETMTVVSGSMTVKLPGSDEWQAFKTGNSFVVEAGSSFDLKIAADCAYLCTYE